MPASKERTKRAVDRVLLGESLDGSASNVLAVSYGAP